MYARFRLKKTFNQLKHHRWTRKAWRMQLLRLAFIFVIQFSNLQEQKRMLGERLYEEILKCIGSEVKTGKITGMILEMDNSEILNLLENEGLLKEKAYEAQLVLEKVANEEKN